MKVVLLAAGIGSRLAPLTQTTPKCLVPINGKPLLDFWLEMLIPSTEIDEIFINVSYLKEQVVTHLTKKWIATEKLHLLHETELLGTAGTLAKNHQKLIEDDVLVIHADNLSYFDLPTFINAYRTRPQNCQLTMMLFATDAPKSCGIVELDTQGRVIKMHEKVENPPSNLANAAVYIMNKSVIEWIKQNKPFDISQDVIPIFEGKINTWINTIYHRDIGTPQSYKLAQTEYQIKVTKID